MRGVARALVLGALIACSAAPAAGAATVQQWNTPGGQYINTKDQFPADHVNGKIVTNVVLPTGYASRKCWPVLYLLHGSSVGVAGTTAPISLQWLDIGDGQLLKMNIPAIVVVPGSGNGWWINDWWNGYRHPAWESWLLQYVVPLVERRVHVCPGRSEHSIAGLSMGGYGAIYLASQRPDYFGSAGSFSGVLSPESQNFLSIFKWFTTTWGPAGKFYAIGHDPLALVGNLRHTRVFVGAGNGIPTQGEDRSLTAIFEEMEFSQETRSFAARARAGHVPVTLDQYSGSHTTQTWFHGLQDMLAWNPFKRSPGSASWTFSTVATTGNAWGYQYAFSHYFPPKTIVQFSLHNGVFSARGAGVVTVTPPRGSRFTARIPFDLRRGKVTEIRHVASPRLVGGFQNLKSVKVAAHQVTPGTAQPIQVSFRTAQALRAGQQYQVAVSSLSFGTGGCNDVQTRLVRQPSAGRLVTVSVTPPATGWCSGPKAALVSEVAQGSTSILGNFLGYTMFSIG